MADAIEKAGVLYQTGYFQRGDAKHLFLKEQIAGGAFGKITRVRSLPRVQDANALAGFSGFPGVDAKGRLIYRINDPVLRSLFMAPRNTLWMRDGLVSMLAGNLRISGRARIPVLAFKTVYHLASLAARAGWTVKLDRITLYILKALSDH